MFLVRDIEAMKGYHDLIESGRREIYQLEK